MVEDRKPRASTRRQASERVPVGPGNGEANSMAFFEDDRRRDHSDPQLLDPPGTQRPRVRSNVRVERSAASRGEEIAASRREEMRSSPSVTYVTLPFGATSSRYVKSAPSFAVEASLRETTTVPVTSVGCASAAVVKVKSLRFSDRRSG